MMSPPTPLSIHRKILTEMLSIPTAPFAEHYVIEHIDRFVARRKRATLTRDRAGNMLVHVKQGNRRVKRPVCITAHLDHPGFVAERMVSDATDAGGGRSSLRGSVRTRARSSLDGSKSARAEARGSRVLRAFWRGGVPKEYFVGSKVRFFVNGTWIRGVIRSITTTMREGRERVDRAMIDVRGDVPLGSIGMWDLPDAKIRGRRIHARDCDDIAGASAMLCAIDELARGRRVCDAYFLFTRAEEVGFVGAIAAAKAKTIPAKCFVVAMETSSERPHAKMGDGPILRVGDRASTFTPSVTAYCHRIARELARDDKRFIYQRKLMDGGTCESSAYCTLGYDATGICIALGNYHNVDAERKTLGAEYVDLYDFENVVKWFVALARSPIPYTGRDETLHTQLGALERNYRSLLRRSRDRAC